MAHFAELDENNIVIAVWKINNEDILDENGIESEQLGINLCKNLYGEEKRFVQTSYNNKFRGRYTTLGFIYDETYNAIRPIKAYTRCNINGIELL